MNIDHNNSKPDEEATDTKLSTETRQLTNKQTIHSDKMVRTPLCSFEHRGPTEHHRRKESKLCYQIE